MPKRKGRTTDAEIEQRVNIIYSLLLQSEPREKILEFASKKWAISRATIDNYLARAKKRMMSDLEDDRHNHLAQAIAQRKDLYRQAYKKQKWFTCLQIADSRDRLLGLEFGINDHINAAIAAGYVVTEPVADSENETENADAAAEAFFSHDDDSSDFADDSGPPHDAEESI